MFGSEYDYFDNWESSGDSENFYNTRQQKHSIRGCLKNEIKHTRCGGVAKAFVAKRNKTHIRNNENLESLDFYKPKQSRIQHTSQAGGNWNMIQSRSKAAQIFQQTSQEKKAVATVKPMLREEESSSNLLEDLLKRQDDFLKPSSKSNFETKEPAHKKEASKKQPQHQIEFQGRLDTSQKFKGLRYKPNPTHTI